MVFVRWMMSVVKRRQRATSIIVIATVYLPAAILATLPLAFVYLGLQALGGRLGWWIGDPNSDDGEEYWAWPLGIAMLALLFGTVAVVMRLLRMRVAPWTWPVGLLVVLMVCLMTWTIGVPPPFWRWS